MTSTLTERALGIQGRMRATARLLTASALAATLAVSGASAALAATVTVTPASGGTAILDSTGASTTYTTLGNIVFQEDVAGQIGLGNIIIKAPAGFEFRASSINVAPGRHHRREQPDPALQQPEQLLRPVVLDQRHPVGVDHPVPGLRHLG